jgi:hypothetical protein
MNQIITALKTAGVPLPSVKYRIWNWLRDHPEKTVTDIEKGLGMSYPPSQALLDMERGGVIKAYSDRTRATGHSGQSYKIKRYSVVNKLDYVNTPLSSLKPNAKHTIPPMGAAKFAQMVPSNTLIGQSHTQLAAPRVVAVAPAATVVFDPASVVDNLTFWQTLQVYNYLKGVLA